MPDDRQCMVLLAVTCSSTALTKHSPLGAKTGFHKGYSSFQLPLLAKIRYNLTIVAYLYWTFLRAKTRCSKLDKLPHWELN